MLLLGDCLERMGEISPKYYLPQANEKIEAADEKSEGDTPAASLSDPTPASDAGSGGAPRLGLPRPPSLGFRRGWPSRGGRLGRCQGTICSVSPWGSTPPPPPKRTRYIAGVSDSVNDSSRLGPVKPFSVKTMPLPCRARAMAFRLFAMGARRRFSKSRTVERETLASLATASGSAHSYFVGEILDMPWPAIFHGASPKVPLRATPPILAEYDAYSNPNWDGEGAEPISGLTVRAAKSIYYLIPRAHRTPDIAPCSDGSIGFEWRRGSRGNRVIYILDVGPGDQAIARRIEPSGAVHHIGAARATEARDLISHLLEL